MTSSCKRSCLTHQVRHLFQVRKYLCSVLSRSVLVGLMRTLNNVAQFNNKREVGLLTLQAMLTSSSSTVFRSATNFFWNHMIVSQRVSIGISYLNQFVLHLHFYLVSGLWICASVWHDRKRDWHRDDSVAFLPAPGNKFNTHQIGTKLYGQYSESHLRDCPKPEVTLFNSHLAFSYRFSFAGTSLSPDQLWPTRACSIFVELKKKTVVEDPNWQDDARPQLMNHPRLILRKSRVQHFNIPLFFRVVLLPMPPPNGRRIVPAVKNLSTLKLTTYPDLHQGLRGSSMYLWTLASFPFWFSCLTWNFSLLMLEAEPYRPGARLSMPLEKSRWKLWDLKPFVIFS